MRHLWLTEVVALALAFLLGYRAGVEHLSRWQILRFGGDGGLMIVIMVAAVLVYWAGGWVLSHGVYGAIDRLRHH